MHNARFAQPAEQEGSAFVDVDPAILPDILCIQEERVVGNDNTVVYGRRRLQIPPSPLRPHYVRAKVRVHHYPDGTLALFHGPRCLASYAADGSTKEQTHGRRDPLPPSSPVDKAAALPTGATTTTEAVN